VIVTGNVADFPPGALPAPLIRRSLDKFLLDSLDLYPGPVISAVHAVARRTGRFGPAMTARDRATYLQARGMPTFSERPPGQPRPARPHVSSANRFPASAGRLPHMVVMEVRLPG
jgi:hypothetical protein